MFVWILVFAWWMWGGEVAMWLLIPMLGMQGVAALTGR